MLYDFECYYRLKLLIDIGLCRVSVSLCASFGSLCFLRIGIFHLGYNIRGNISALPFNVHGISSDDTFVSNIGNFCLFSLLLFSLASFIKFISKNQFISFFFKEPH